MLKYILIIIFSIIIMFIISKNLSNGYQEEINELKSILKEEEFRAAGLEGQNTALNLLLLAYRLNSKIEVTVTAYTARIEETNCDPENTSIMETPVVGWTVAVSRDLAHLKGQRIYIPGFGVRRVNDLMNSRYTRRIDILVGTVEEARIIGIIKNVIISVIEPEIALRNVLEEIFKEEQ
jgi:3D (Asp-Asp-Asp) domain-containing protein